LSRLRDMLGRALERTATLWPDVVHAERWVHEAATILANDDRARARTVKRRYRNWIRHLEQEIAQAGLSSALRAAAAHFVKVTRSYGADLFHCYGMADLPRTNNALEQAFGSLRYHERRASGRKVASPSLVLSGCVRMSAALFTRTHDVTLEMLAAVPHGSWRVTRAELKRRRQARCLRYRFRKNPAGYLAGLEDACGGLSLPS
jgi:hypothetical protein